MRHQAGRMAFGGMMTAVAVVIMSLGSLIPVNTYVCPVLCILIARPVLERCGRRLAWCYYMASALLSLLLAPDREAAVVYLFLGYYPMIRYWFQRVPQGVRETVKILFFTIAGAVAYGVLFAVMGGAALTEELGSSGLLTVIMVLLWDALFLLVDRLLSGRQRKM